MGFLDSNGGAGEDVLPADQQWMVNADTAECVCGGELIFDTEADQWFHARIEDFSHEPRPKERA